MILEFLDWGQGILIFSKTQTILKQFRNQIKWLIHSIVHINQFIMKVPKLRIVPSNIIIHFAIKRYFEDIGFVCDLYLYNTLPNHFLPEQILGN